jgi:hypothetical protein
MRIAFGILKVLIALWFITGALYMMGAPASLANPWAAENLPEAFWITLVVFQILFATLFGLSAFVKSLHPNITHISAIGLIIITLMGLFLYSAYAGFPGILWGLIPAILVGFLMKKNY